MTFQQLHYFLITAQCGTIAHAAEKCFLSTSGMSKALLRLEEEVGTPLFYRDSNRITLSDAGIQFQAFAKEALALQPECVQAIRNEFVSHHDMLQISIPEDGTVNGPVYEVLEHCRDVVFAQKIMTASEAKDALENNTVDFALSHIPIVSEQILCEKLFEDELCLAVGQTHRLAKRVPPRITLPELKDEILFLPSQHGDLRNYILTQFQSIGLIPQTSDAAGQNLFELISRGAGVCMLRKYDTIEQNVRQLGICTLTVTAPKLTISTYLSTRQGASFGAAGKMFYEKLHIFYRRRAAKQATRTAKTV